MIPNFYQHVGISSEIFPKESTVSWTIENDVAKIPHDTMNYIPSFTNGWAKQIT